MSPLEELRALGFSAAPPDWPILDRTIAGRRCRLALGLHEIGEIERLTGKSIGAVMQALASAQFDHRMVLDVIRLALVRGGDCTPAQAEAVASVFVAPKLIEHAVIASEIVAAALSNFDIPEQPGEPEAQTAGPAI